MKKKHLCLLTLIAVSIILIIGGYNIIKGAAKSNIFTAEKINISTSVNNKTKNEINQLCKNSGVFFV